jgi:hypothetical protein
MCNRRRVAPGLPPREAEPAQGTAGMPLSQAMRADGLIAEVSAASASRTCASYTANSPTLRFSLTKGFPQGRFVDGRFCKCYGALPPTAQNLQSQSGAAAVGLPGVRTARLSPLGCRLQRGIAPDPHRRSMRDAARARGAATNTPIVSHAGHSRRPSFTT